MESVQPSKQSGQLMIEFILLMVLLFGGTVLMKRLFQEKNIIGALVAGPWARVRHMAEVGTWDTSKNFDEAHPQINMISREGDEQ